MGFWEKTFDVVGKLGSGVEWRENEHKLDPNYVRLARNAVALQEAGRLTATALAKLADFDPELLRLLAGRNPLPPVGIEDGLTIHRVAAEARVIAIEDSITQPRKASPDPNWRTWNELCAAAITRMEYGDFAIFADRTDETAYIQMIREYDNKHGPVLYIEASAGSPDGPDPRSMAERAALGSLGWAPPDKAHSIPNYQYAYCPDSSEWCSFEDGMKVAELISASFREGFGVRSPYDVSVEEGH